MRTTEDSTSSTVVSTNGRSPVQRVSHGEENAPHLKTTWMYDCMTPHSPPTSITAPLDSTGGTLPDSISLGKRPVRTSLSLQRFGTPALWNWNRQRQGETVDLLFGLDYSCYQQPLGPLVTSKKRLILLRSKLHRTVRTFWYRDLMCPRYCEGAKCVFSQ